MPATQNPNEPEQIPAFRPVPVPLYPTLDSLDSVMALAMSQLPINKPNELRSLLLTYHNTLLSVSSKNDVKS